MRRYSRNFLYGDDEDTGYPPDEPGQSGPGSPMTEEYATAVQQQAEAEEAGQPNAIAPIKPEPADEIAQAAEAPQTLPVTTSPSAPPAQTTASETEQPSAIVSNNVAQHEAMIRKELELMKQAGFVQEKPVTVNITTETKPDQGRDLMIGMGLLGVAAIGAAIFFTALNE